MPLPELLAVVTVIAVIYLCLAGDVGPHIGPFNGIRLVFAVVLLVLLLLWKAGA